MLKEAVASGEYTSTSEVVREALRVWRTRRTVLELEAEELRQLWTEGIESGQSFDARPVFKRLREKYGKQLNTE